MIREKQTSGLTWFSSDRLQVPHAMFSRRGGVSTSCWSSLNCGSATG